MRLLTVLLATIIALSFIPSTATGQVIAERYEIVVELDGGVDMEVAAAGFVEAASITPAERCWVKEDKPSTNLCRLNHRYTLVINGFSVFLTEFEIRRAHDILDGSNNLGIKSISDPTAFTLPVITDSFTSAGTGSAAFSGSEVVPAGVQRIGGALADGSNVGVAVIDTGGAIDHPDVRWGEGVDCTGAERNDLLPDYYDGHGHGTHVSGTIAALDNEMGVVGVAPGATIYPVKVLTDQGSGSYASIICGLEWVAEHDDIISVANLSLGGDGYITACGQNDPMHNAMCILTETVIVTVAAGNSSVSADSFSPANYPEVVTVSAYADFDGQPGGYSLPPDAQCRAMSDDDSIASFSNDGAMVDVAAPGVCVLSTLPGGTYGYYSGTSMAAPHMAGCFTGYLSRNPDQRDIAQDYVLEWSQSRSHGPSLGDGDGYAEPLAYCGSIPRYTGGA